MAKLNAGPGFTEFIARCEKDWIVKRLVAYSLLTLLAVGFPSAPAFAQLLTSPSNEPEVIEPKKEETPAVKEEAKKSEESTDSKDAKKAKKTKNASEKEAKKAEAASKKAADAAAKKTAADAKRAAAAAKKAGDSQGADLGNEASEAADVAAGKSTQPIGRRDKMRTPDADDIKVLEEKLEKKAAKKAKKDGDDAKKTGGDVTDAAKKADDAKDVKDKKASDDDEEKDGTESGAKTAKKDKVPFGKRMASFTTGAILGYPVAMAKRSVYQTKNGTRDFVGETKNPLLLIPAMVVSAPYGFVGGFFEGAQYSVMNSWKASGDEPFSKEAFSLDD